MKILFLRPPSVRKSYAEHFVFIEPLTHLFVAQDLRQRHELRLADLRMKPGLDAQLGGFSPDVAVVGTHPLTHANLDAVLGHLRARFPAIKILLVTDAEYGNSHMIDRPMDLAHPLADAMVSAFFLAHIRVAVSRAIDAWEKGLGLKDVPWLRIRERDGSWTATAPGDASIMEIGVPDRTLLGKRRGKYLFGGIGRTAYLLYTYGCHYKCRFCPMSKHDGTISVRALPDVVRELDEMTEPNVFLTDFEPFLAPQAMRELADAVEKRGIRKKWYMLTRADTALRETELLARWKRAGLSWLYLGLDGSSPQQLKEMRKGNTVETNEAALRAVEKLGIGVSTGFLVRSDFTREDFAALRAHVRKLRPPTVDFTIETPLVGTTLYDDVEKQLTTRDGSLFDLYHAVLPTALPLREFYREMLRMHLFAMRQSSWSVMRHWPLRDVLRNGFVVPRAMMSAWNAHRDHGDGAQRPLAVASAT